MNWSFEKSKISYNLKKKKKWSEEEEEHKRRHINKWNKRQVMKVKRRAGATL